jgi:hypothetical protein
MRAILREDAHITGALFDIQLGRNAGHDAGVKMGEHPAGILSR